MVDRMSWRLSLDRDVDNRVRASVRWPARTGGGGGGGCPPSEVDL